MNKSFVIKSVWFFVAAVILAACAKTEPSPTHPSKFGSGTGTYSLSLVAGKGVIEVKALNLDGDALYSSWGAGDEVTVYNRTKSAALDGKLIAATAGVNTTLSGTLTGTIAPDDELELSFLSGSYDNQDGSLAYIADHCDYATALVTVASVGGGVVTVKESNAIFQPHQAIVQFTLQEKDGSPITQIAGLEIKADSETITVTPAAETNILFVAVPAVADATFDLTVTRNDTDNLRFLEKTGVTLEWGQYYKISAKLSRAVDVGDEATLRQYLAEASYADHVFRLTADITLAGGELSVPYRPTVHLNGKTLSGGNSSRIFNVAQGGQLTLVGGGTVTNGNATDGGAILNAGTLVINNVTISGNTASNQGGAIFNQGGAITFNGGSVSNNAATNAGGIHLQGGSLQITGGAISENSSSANCGGVNLTSGSNMTMSGGSIRDNVSGQNDGGVYIGGGSAMTLTGGSITGNTAINAGRGAGISVGGSLTISGNPQVYDNTVNSKARNIFLPSGKVMTVNGLFTGGARVGVLCKDGKGTAFTSGYKTNNPGTAPNTVFFADPTDQQVILDGDEAATAEEVQIKSSTTSYAMLRETIKLAISHIYSATAVTIDWGDGSSHTETSLDKDGVLTHEFTQPGTYIIQAKAGDVKEIFKITVTGLLALDKAIEELMNSNKCWVMTHRAHTPDKTIPENSVSAVKAAIAAGADFVETDTQLTSDKQVVICHDDTIDATTTGSGKIRNMTLEQIQSYYLTDRNGNATTEKMPTLKAFLEAARGKVYVNLDYSPRTASTSQVMEVVEELGMTGQVFYYCNSETKVNEVLAINPDAHVYFFHSMTGIYDKMGKQGRYFTQANWYNNLKKTDASVVNAVKANEAGLLVSTTMLHVLANYIPEYSVDSEMVTSLFNWFPTCKLIMTDCPAEMIAELTARGKR